MSRAEKAMLMLLFLSMYAWALGHSTFSIFFGGLLFVVYGLSEGREK